MINVSVHDAIEHANVAFKYARALEAWKNGGPLPSIFGNEGQWEESKRLCQSFIFKIHIRLPDQEPWSARTPAAARKSDSYLVYSRHFLYPDHYQLISIMMPARPGWVRSSVTCSAASCLTPCWGADVNPA